MADGLRSEGFKVVEEKSSPVGAHSTTDAIKEVLRGIDVVLLVVHKNDGVAGPMPPFERVLHDAKVIQQSLGDGKVVLLVEESVDGLPETGLTHIRFPTSRADMILQDVVNKIGVTSAPPVRDLHVRIPMSEQAMSSALRVPWLLVLVVLFSAAIPLVVALNSILGGDDNGSAPAETTLGVTAAPSQPQPADPATGAEAGGQSTTQGDPAAGAAGAPAAAESEPAAPAATLGGANALLPATCQVDLRKGSLLDNALSCQSSGQLVLEGLEGPWHNEIAAVAVDEGVIGQLQYELPASGLTNGPSVIDLTYGSIVLNPADAAFGVARLTLQFSANGQHVHLFRNPDGSGDFATLRFSLDQ
ncbi:MAG: hypothetical protein ACR2QK_17300 [Acidimicrobiales bacterium]